MATSQSSPSKLVGWLANKVRARVSGTKPRSRGPVPTMDNTMGSLRLFCSGTQHTTQHNTTQHNTTQHNTTQHNTTQHNTQHNTTHNTNLHGCRCVQSGGRRRCCPERSPVIDESLTPLERVRLYSTRLDDPPFLFPPVYWFSLQMPLKCFSRLQRAIRAAPVCGARAERAVCSGELQSSKDRGMCVSTHAPPPSVTSRKQVGAQDVCATVVPCIEPLVRDPEPAVRQQLAESIPPLCAWLRANVRCAYLFG